MDRTLPARAQQINTWIRVYLPLSSSGDVALEVKLGCDDQEHRDAKLNPIA